MPQQTPRTLHGIDPTAPGGIERLLAFHRAQFGDLRMEAGGEAGGDPAPAGADPAPAPAPSPAPAPAPQPAPQPAPAPAWDGKVESLPADAQKMIRDLRSENASRRTGQQELVRQFAKAAGIELPGDQADAPDPAQLTEQLTASQQAARQAAIELAVYRTAGTAGADPDALLDSRRFVESLADIDPSDGGAITAAIQAAVGANPKLKAGRAPGASSVDHGAAGSGESTKRTPRSLDESVRATYGTA
ncbi:hypothetical protein [Kineococcus gypseus]|uniref:hypothetical protein n=1 Tax=Kineococcus gypseus TaxID=1637102 RepID=UPI003D7C633B